MRKITRWDFVHKNIYGEEDTDYEIFEDQPNYFDFGDYLSGCQIDYDYDENNNTYYILNDTGARTGEEYRIVSIS